MRLMFGGGGPVEAPAERRQLRRIPRVLANRIYVLHDGRIVEHGTHDELMQLDGRYAELFALQASAYFPEMARTRV